MIKKYPAVINSIEFIVDDKLSEKHKIWLGEKLVPIYNYDYLSLLNSYDYDYLIASDYEHEIYKRILIK